MNEARVGALQYAFMVRQDGCLCFNKSASLGDIGVQVGTRYAVVQEDDDLVFCPINKGIVVIPSE